MDRTKINIKIRKLVLKAILDNRDQDKMLIIMDLEAWAKMHLSLKFENQLAQLQVLEIILEIQVDVIAANTMTSSIQTMKTTTTHTKMKFPATVETISSKQLKTSEAEKVKASEVKMYKD